MDDGSLADEIGWADRIMRHGAVRQWYRNGNRRSEVWYEQGLQHGLSRWWYMSGKIEQEMTYVNGCLHGRRRRWHFGILAQENNYVADELHGLQWRWGIDGSLLEKTLYIDGKRQADRWIYDDPSESTRTVVDDTDVQRQLAEGRRIVLFSTNNDIRAALDLVRARECDRAVRRILVESLDHLRKTMEIVDLFEAIDKTGRKNKQDDEALQKEAARRLLAENDPDERQMMIVARGRVDLQGLNKNIILSRLLPYRLLF